MGFIDEIKAKAKSCKKTIVLPESEDIRTYEAAEAILKEGTANLVLIGSEETTAREYGSLHARILMSRNTSLHLD